MKKLLLFSFVVVFFSTNVNAQRGQQLTNAGFEDWENVNVGQDEPVHWSSIKTSDNNTVNPVAPVNWAKSDTAHSGNYSLRLFNVSSIIGAVATGSMTNGRFHTTFNPEEGLAYSDFSDARWNTPFTKRPDSVAVWIKYYPVGSDTLQAKFLLHKDSCTIGVRPDVQQNVIAYAQINVVGEHDNWTRVAVPFVYSSEENPQYILTILTSGAGLHSLPNSMALYDDVELIYNPSSVIDNQVEGLNVYYADGVLHIKNLPANSKGAFVEVVDLSGRVMVKKALTGNHVNISDVSLHRGIYLVSVVSSNHRYTKKLFVH